MPVSGRQQGRVRVVVIDRPDRANSIDLETAQALAAAFDEIERDDDTSAVVLTGAGDRVFSAGMDLKAVEAGQAAEINGVSVGFAGLVRRDFPKPIVAAVNGAAMGGGFEIVLACDLVVAARDAKLGLPEVKRSLVAAGGALLRLPRRVPYGIAMELALTGDTITAERAYELGLVNRLAEPGGAVEAALELAAAIARNGPLALEATKATLQQQADWTEAEFWQRQAELAEPVMRSEDAREGATAFAEKREPVWQGR
jgi:enoyl-CoA hydratase